MSFSIFFFFWFKFFLFWSIILTNVVVAYGSRLESYNGAFSCFALVIIDFMSVQSIPDCSSNILVQTCAYFPSPLSEHYLVYTQ